MRVPRGLQELNVQVSKLIEQLTVQLGRSPTITELAKASDSTEEEVLEALESGRAYSSLSLSRVGLPRTVRSIRSRHGEDRARVRSSRTACWPGFKVLDDESGGSFTFGSSAA